MRHKKKRQRTLGRPKAQREALMRNLAESLILHEAIETTKVKAKELRKFVEPLITTAKGGTLTDRRRLIQALYTDNAVRKLMDDLGPRYKERKGGYTRVLKIGFRPNDGAEKVRIELV